MTTRPFPSNNNNTSFDSKTRAVFLALTISASVVILASLLYFLYHLWHSLLHRARTIPFDSTPPLKLQRFSYKELKLATADFHPSNVIGKGGSGTVFRGILKSGKLIAIKRLDTLSLQTEREFQNELHILGGLRSPHLVTLLGYCVDKNSRVLVYEYMPNKSLQESLFAEGFSSLSWERRFEIVSDVARALEFLHLGCDPPVIHGDIKPSNVLLDSDHRAKVSDFGLSRVKVEGEFGADMFSQDLGKSQELSGNLTAGTAASTPNEVDFALALQASSSSKNGKACGYSTVKAKTGSGSEKGKELVSSNGTTLDCDWNHSKFVPYDDHYDEPCSVEHSKELMMMSSSNPCFSVDEGLEDGSKQWGKDWWWRQDGSGELCSKDYVTEWIGSQICTEKSQVVDHDHRSSSPLERLEFESRERRNKNRPKKMQEWWREEHLAEMTKKKGNNHSKLIRGLEIRFKKGFKIPHFERFRFRGRRNSADKAQNECNDNNNGGEFSFRRGWRKNRNNNSSMGSEFWSGDLFSRELSSTTSMRGTLCYVAPEYGGFGYLMEKADIYSFGVLILVIVSGRRPLHVLASPMKLEKANLISWCRQLAQGGNVLELVDEKLRDEYNKEQANLCINLALTCLQKTPELRPDIGDVVRILRGEMDLPPVPFEFSPSPSSKLYSRSRRKHKFTAE